VERTGQLSFEKSLGGGVAMIPHHIYPWLQAALLAAGN
jgi:hypothetical protein